MRPLALGFFLATLALAQDLPSKDDLVRRLRAFTIQRAREGIQESLPLKIGAGQPTPAQVVSAGEKGLRVRADGGEADISWDILNAEGLYRFLGPIMKPAPAEALRDYLLLGGLHLGRAEEDAFKRLLAALEAKDAAAAKAVKDAIQKPKNGDPKPGDPSLSPDAPPEEPAGGTWKERILSTSKVEPSAYARAAIATDPASVHHRLGPDWAFYHKDAKADFPEIHQRFPNGEYVHKNKGDKAVDWTGMAGQVLYAPLRPGNAGADRVRLCWSFHENHGGGKFWHVYQLAPTMNEWYCKSPDPGLAQAPWKQAAGGALERPITVERGRVEWSNCGIMVFANGLIGATGYGNNDDRYPFTQLPPGKVPTAVAVTPNNEFALIACWDLQKTKGQVAVVALEARALAHHSWHYAGLPNVGTYTRLKLMGFVDLPDLAAPTAISASCDVARWHWLTDNAKERLDDAGVREQWAKGGDDKHRAASAGFAVVASRAEGKVAFIDLRPLFQYLRKMYFTTAENFEKTKNEGPAPNQWPFTFDTAPEARPKVVEVVGVARPTAVAAGYPAEGGFGSKAFVTTMDGRLVIYDVGVLADPQANAGVRPVGLVPIGRNPTSISYGRSAPRRTDLVLCCRGDREIVWVSIAGQNGKVTRRLKDKRLEDPVAVAVSDTRGAAVLSVADFKGGKIVNYLCAPIDSWGEKLFGGLGPDGKAEFECTGVLEVPGRPFHLSCAEVN
jgi:hypothetical protein